MRSQLREIDASRVAESQAGVRPVTGRPERPGLPGRPARSDKLMLLHNLLKKSWLTTKHYDIIKQFIKESRSSGTGGV